MTKIHLQGATGNQLFCVFAGIAHEVTSGSKAIFDESYLQPIEVRHPGGILDFELYFNGKKYCLSSDLNRLNKLGKYFDRIVFKTMNKWAKFPDSFIQHRSKVFGFDSDFYLDKRYRKIIGFFQTFVYADIAQESLGKLEIRVKNPSNWFNEKSIEISNKNKSVAIHIRRGDYLQNIDGIGLLSFEYFYSVLTLLTKQTKVKTAYIFSDEEIELLEFTTRFPEIEFIAVAAPSESKPIESIILMSLASYRIISNSSFSWWAAYLTKDHHSNFTPDPWFRNKSVPELLIPAAWNNFTSIWTERDDL